MNFPVTVIIPCHNAQQWLPSTLASVAAQSHVPAQVILIADRCTDASAQVVRDFPMDITIIQTDFGNAGPARNAGIRMAQTPWIALLDADDQWYPDHLKNAAVLLADTDHVAYCAGHDFMDNQDHTLPLPDCFWPGWPQPHTQLTHDDYVDLMCQDMHFGHSTVLYRRDRFDAVHGFNPQQIRRHDIDLWLRMIHNQHWAYHPGPAARYRNQTPGSISRNMVEVSYYQLSALLRNQQAYTNPKLDGIIQSYARRAMSVALHDADKKWAGELRRIARPHLPSKFRMGYDLIGLCPPLFKAMIKLKRQTMGRVSRQLKHRQDERKARSSQQQETR